jgi:prepilin-type N-terminal cleavage/methylation domain-containing protein/prepilin-type processing-associated H-X9-DG protein
MRSEAKSQARHARNDSAPPADKGRNYTHPAARKSFISHHLSIINHPSSIINSHGFTLIELLVVIAVVALLMAILLPALQSVRRKTKAIVCRANVKQWGQILAAYTDENEGYLPCGTVVAAVWLFRGPMPYEDDPAGRPLLQPVSTDGIRRCPTTVEEYVGGSATIGLSGAPGYAFHKVTVSTAVTRSGTWWSLRPPPAFTASYGFNAWLLTNSSRSARLTAAGLRGVSVSSVRGAAGVPVLLDSMVPDGHPDNASSPPDEEASFMGRQSEMVPLCLNRHDGYVNGLFLDWSARGVGLRNSGRSNGTAISRPPGGGRRPAASNPKTGPNG